VEGRNKHIALWDTVLYGLYAHFGMHYIIQAFYANSKHNAERVTEYGVMQF